MFVVPVPIIRRNVIVRRFINAGAISPSSAKAPEDVGSFKGFGLMYSRLISQGILVQTESNKYYIDKTKI